MLPDHLQAVIDAVYHEHLTIREAATRLNVTRRTVSKRLQHALALITVFGITKF